MNTPNTPPTPFIQTPDWDTISEDILCPLCEYNLRGVSEARCPECGYRFDWPEVLDPQRRLHRYIFEHHPERNIWSFRKTLMGGFMPSRFWRGLHPVQPVNTRRLRRYWLVVALLFFLCIEAINVGVIILAARDEQASNVRQHAIFLSPISPTSPPRWVLKQYGSYDTLKASLENQYPTQFGWLLIRDAGLRQWWRHGMEYQWPLLGVLWPWLTFGSLLVFRWSMRRAKIRPAHVLRCVVYSADVLFWAGPISVGLMLAWLFLPSRPPIEDIVIGAMVVLGIALVLHTLYRLVTAYRLYLRFDHPILTILASQVIVALAMIKLIALFTIDRT